VPVGLFVAFRLLELSIERETPTRKLTIDKVGIALLVVWWARLQIMLDKGKDEEWLHRRSSSR